MKIILTATFTALAVLLSSCTSSPESSRNSDRRNPLGQTDLGSQVYFDSFGTIPKVANHSSYMVRLHNDSSRNYKIISAQLSPVTKGVNSSAARLDQNNCVELAAQSHCGFILNYPANNTTSYILTAEIENSQHQREIIKTALLAGNANSTKNGISYSLLTDVDSHAGNYHIGTPVYLTSDFTQISASEGTLYCPNGYSHGSSCTYYKDGHITKDQLLITKLSATKADETKVEVSSRSHIRATGFSHLLISLPEDIELDNESHVVRSTLTIFNLGGESANNFTLDPSGLQRDKVTVDANTCGSEILPYATCEIILKIQSDRNGANILRASYQDSSNPTQPKELVYQFIHTVNINEPHLIWAMAGANFENSVLNESREAEITLTAKNITFDKITISKDSNPDFEIVGNPSRLCDGGQLSVDSLTNDPLCTFRIKYKPQALQMTARNFNFIASGSYVDSNGISRTFAYPLAIPYSAPFDASNVISINNDQPITLSAPTDDPQEFIINLRNNDNYPITLSVPSFSSAILDARIDLDQCQRQQGQQSITLAASGSQADNCNFKIRYAPRIPTTNPSLSSLQIKVLNFNGIDVSANNLLATQEVRYSAVDPATPILSGTLIHVTGDTAVTPPDNTKKWLKAGEPINFTYRITNNTANTTAKAITITDLPAGWNITTNNCTNQSLGNNQSCQIIFSGSYTNTGEQEFKENTVNIRFKYAKDDRDGANHLGNGNTNPKIQVYEMPTRISASEDIESVNVIPGDNTRTTFNLGDGGYPGMNPYTMNVATLPSGFPAPPNSTCTLDFLNRTCSINLTTPRIVTDWSSATVNFANAQSLTLDRSSMKINFISGNPTTRLLGTGQAGDVGLDITSPTRFTVGSGAKANCITDNLTGLMWFNSVVSTVTGSVHHNSWYQALERIESLNTSMAAPCGHNDWHMPTINELASLNNYSVINHSEWLRTIGFNVTRYSTYGFMSSSTTAFDTDRYWIISFAWAQKQGNFGGNKANSASYQLLAVSKVTNVTNYPVQIPVTGESGGGSGADSGVPWPSPRFYVGNTARANCVTDRLTGLMWVRDLNSVMIKNGANGSPTTWQNAVDSINEANSNGGYCGYTDWRLPSIVEMSSLINHSNYTKAWLEQQGFTNTQSLFWTNTYVRSTGNRMQINLYTGVDYPDINISPNRNILPVRSAL